MKVFLSWSGDLSRRIATALADWLPPVINAVEPFISSEIEKGAHWAAELSHGLQGSRAGIICLTPNNLDSPWLNYEAGALSKSLAGDDEAPRVWTYLFRLRAADVRYPLAQFQHTEATRDDTARLLRGINQAVLRCGERALPEAQLARSFEHWWPKLEAVLKGFPQPGPVNEPRGTPLRSSEEMLAEVLEILRSQQGTSAASEPEPSPIVGVTPPVKVYLEGETRAVSEVIEFLLGFASIANVQLGTDLQGTFLHVAFSKTIERSWFEAVITATTQEYGVTLRQLSW